MTVKTRKEVREALGSLLSSALTGAGNPVHTVYDYMPPTFDGKSPVIVIGSTGIERNEVMQFNNWFPMYYYELVTLVAREADGEEAAEDELDTVAQKLYETLETNQFYSGYWESLDYADRSMAQPVTIGGDPYLMEVTPVKVEVMG